MTKKVGPYVGVTGFMSSAEVIAALALVPQGSRHQFMVGILMSSKTLAGQENKWPGRYPKKEAVADIFPEDPRALNLVHYNTDHPDTLVEQLSTITNLAGPYLDGFQLNVAWPPIEQVADYRRKYPDQFLVLQIGSRAMAEVESTERFTNLVGGYLPMIDAILIDPSGGKGELFDVVKGAEYLRAVRDYPTLGLGIAGGLGPDTLDSLYPLVREFPKLSIDAEGRLRTQPPEDALCLDSMSIYIEDAFLALAGRELPGVRLRGLLKPYGFAEYVRCSGLGHNMLRTGGLAQPAALEIGDRLATGDRVLSHPRDGGNGIVMLHLSGGHTGHWVGVPARIPVALLTEGDGVPSEIWEYGDE